MPAYSMFLTEDCNLGCGYCALAAKQPGRLSVDHGMAHIDYMFSRRDEQIDLCFFGTEVLLEQVTLRKLVVYAEEAHARLKQREAAGEDVVVPRLKFDLTTNGTLLRRELIEFLGEHNVGITLSLDGDKAYQDAWRVTKKGQGTYDIIAKHFEQLAAYRPLVTIAMTVTPQSVEAFFDNVVHIHRLGFRKIDFSLTRDDPAWTPEHFDVYRREVNKVSQYYVERLAAGDEIYMGAFDPVIERTTDSTQGNCGMGSSNLAIATDGTIYPCWKYEGWEQAKIGTVATGIDPDKVKPFTDFRNDNVLECRTCEYQQHCERCSWLNLTSAGDMYSKAQNGCRERKATIPAALAAQKALKESDNPIYLERLERLAIEALKSDHQKGFVVFRKNGKMYKIPAEVMAGYLKEDNPTGPTQRPERRRLAQEDGDALMASAKNIPAPRRDIEPGGIIPASSLLRRASRG